MWLLDRPVAGRTDLAVAATLASDEGGRTTATERVPPAVEMVLPDAAALPREKRPEVTGRAALPLLDQPLDNDDRPDEALGGVVVWMSIAMVSLFSRDCREPH